MAKKSNCTVHGKPMYRVRAQVGTDEHGRPVMKNFYGDGKKEAEQRRDAWLEKHQGAVVDVDASFGQVARFFTYKVLVSSNLAESTIDLYEGQYRTKVAPAQMMIRPISSITRGDIQLFLADLSVGKIDGKPVKITAGALNNTVKYLRKLFAWLATEGYCDNLMLGIAVPRIQKTSHQPKEIQVFDASEVRRILATDSKRHFLYHLAFSTGLREGELIALKYSDIKDGVLTVNKQIHDHYRVDPDGYRERVREEQDLKTTSSYRRIPLTEATLAEFRQHWRWHLEEQVKNGYQTDYLFTTSSGGILEVSNFRTAWVRHLKHAGVPFRKFHACRATFCTQLCENGVPLETASKLMGHASVDVTARYYRFVTGDEMKAAVAAIDHLFTDDGDSADGDTNSSGDQVATTA